MLDVCVNRVVNIVMCVNRIVNPQHRADTKNQLLASPYGEYMHEEDLFGIKEPWELWEEYGGDQDLYFFCELKRLNLADSHVHRIDRKIGGGTWREGYPIEPVYDENGNPNPIGRKRKFRYENRGSKEHAGWFLDEYNLLVSRGEKASNYHYDFPFVICRLRAEEEKLVIRDNGL